MSRRLRRDSLSAVQHYRERTAARVFDQQRGVPGRQERPPSLGLVKPHRNAEIADALRLHCTCGRSYLTALELTQCTHGEPAEPASAPHPEPQSPRDHRARAIAAGVIVPRDGDDPEAA